MKQLSVFLIIFIVLLFVTFLVWFFDTPKMLWFLFLLIIAGGVDD